MAEETGEPERVKAVVAERVRTRRLVVEQLTQSLDQAEGSRLEDVELGIGGQELLDLFVVPSVQRLQQVGQSHLLCDLIR